MNGYYDAHITKKFYEEMLQDPDDIRWNVLWPSEGTIATGAIKGVPEINPNMKIFIGKYPGKAAYKDMRSNDIPVIRLAEVYLNAAEAAFKLNDKATAQTYLNAIVKRANNSKSVALADVTLERILLERAKELVGEGHRFFDSLASQDKLAKTILYCLNPKDNEVFATMAYTFNDGSVPGKMQLGSGWWFLDQEDGMRRQLNCLSALGLLSRFVGMLTDSRSFISYPRHEYFRRILCEVLACDIEAGKLPSSEMERIKQMVEDISYNNAKNYFNF